MMKIQRTNIFQRLNKSANEVMDFYISTGHIGQHSYKECSRCPKMNRLKQVLRDLK